MSTSTVSNLSGSYLQQALASALQSAGITSKTSNLTSAASSSPSDTTELSPAAQLAGTLEQLQQSDPAKYQQVTAQIATNLLSAAQTAQSQGNSAAASQLTQLATDFSSASQSGQLPNLQDLAQAVSGAIHHRHHHAKGSSPASSSTSSTTSPAASQLLSSLKTSASQSTQNANIDPGAIIFRTLSAAGINISTS